MKPFAVGVQSAGPTTVRAVCTCGWVGPRREWVKSADTDALKHTGVPHA